MEDKINNVLIVLGATIGIANIENIMGIVLLSFQLLLILIKFFKKVYTKIKNKNYDISKETEELIENIKKLGDDDECSK